MYILYLRCEDALLAIVILCASLPTTTTIAGQWLNSSVFHDDIKLMGRKRFIYIICHDNYLFHAKNWEVLSQINIHL